MSDVEPAPDGRPRSDDPHDDELLGCFWAQLRHGQPLSETQAQHLFNIAFSAGRRFQDHEHKVAQATEIALYRERPSRWRRSTPPQSAPDEHHP